MYKDTKGKIPGICSLKDGSHHSWQFPKETFGAKQLNLPLPTNEKGIFLKTNKLDEKGPILTSHVFETSKRWSRLEQRGQEKTR